MTCCPLNIAHPVLKGKNQKKGFFLSKSMPNFNFAELIVKEI